MVNNVKLEIARQIIVEKIANIYNKLDSNISNIEQEQLKFEYEEACNERDLILAGDIFIINKILSQKKETKNNE